MNKDDVIRMAREAGLLRAGDGWTEPHRWGATEVSKFAALAFAAGAAHEREACAGICDRWEKAVNAKEAIRARGQS
jgi:hypothetical protein